MNTLNYLKQLKDLDVDCLPGINQKSDGIGRIAAKREYPALPEGETLSYFISAVSILLSKYSASNEAFFLLGQNNTDKWPFYMSVNTEKVEDLLKAAKETAAAFEDELFVQKTKEIHYDSPVELCVNTPADHHKTLSFEINKNQLIMHAKPVYTEGMIEGMADALVHILAELLTKEKISEIVLVDQGAIRLLDTFNSNEKEYDTHKSMADLLEDSFEKFSSTNAVVYKNTAITYGQLEETSRNLAGHLLKQGCKSEEIVGILVPRSEYMTICPVGVIRAGCAYQPLDPTYPVERLEFMLNDAGVSLLIADESLLSLVPGFQGKTLLTKDIPSLPQYKESLPLCNASQLFIILYTSGSTGVPKGCLLEHGNVAAFCAWYQDFYQLDKDAKVTAYASFGFDANMMDTYPALLSGGCVHIISEEIRLDLIKLNEYFEQKGITHAFMTTQVCRQFALNIENKSLKFLSLGGETLGSFKEQTPYALVNLYGPTEGTIVATHFVVNDGWDNVPIGKTVANLKGYIVDAHFNRLPVGAPGELVIAGPQVARGYHNRPELSAFIENPFETDPMYQRLYKTGDIVRYLPDGNIEFVGRRDGQVKIRGFRIELAEVEAVIREFDGIEDVTVVAFDEQTGGKYMAAYVVAGHEIDLEQLKAFVLKNKPPYMLPAVMVRIDQIPLNQNQKVNKKALPLPTRITQEVIAPETDTQIAIRNCLADAVGYEEISIDADFFQCGLTSISAIRFTVLLAEQLGVPIKISDLTEYNTIQKLEPYVLSKEKVIHSRESIEEAPLSKTQQGIFFECLRQPESTAYNLPFLCKLTALIDLHKLVQSVAALVKAHPYLTITLAYNDQGEIYQKKGTGEFALPTRKMSGGEFLEYKEHLARPFELVGSRLFRMELIETEGETYLFFDFHHLISDGGSFYVFFDELKKAYQGEALEEETYSGFEVALEELRTAKTSTYTKAKEYYLGKYKDLDMESLPLKDKNDGTPKKGNVSVKLNHLLEKDVMAFCTSAGITPNVFFTGIFGLWTARATGSDESVFTTIYNGRNDVRLANTICMLVKTLPVYSQISGNMQLTDYLNSIREQLMNNMMHDIYSFEEISKGCHITSELLFAYQGPMFQGFTLGESYIQVEEIKSNLPMETISVQVFVEEGAYLVDVDFRADLYEEGTMKNFIHSFYQCLTSALVADTLDHIIMTTEDQLAVLDTFNQNAQPYDGEKSITDLLNETFKKHAGREAVIFKDHVLHYEDLDGLTRNLAGELMKHGVQKKDIVGVLVRRSESMAVCSIGTLRAGAAYLPLDPSYPPERLGFMLEDTGAKVLIADKDLLQLVPGYEGTVIDTSAIEELQDSDCPLPAVLPEDLFIILYTSGSTGTPKGCLLEHGNLVAFCHWYQKYYTLKPSSKVAAYASYGFDANMMDLYPALTSGASVYIIEEDIRLDLIKINDYFNANGITHSFMTTQVGRQFALSTTSTALQHLSVGGEALVPTKGQFSFNLYNGYGPTECTIFTTAFKIDGDYDNVPIGKPLSNLKCYIVDKNLQRVPVGIPGELCVSGPQVSRGYLNRPEVTQKVFVKNPFDRGPAYERLYRTGDIVRYLPDGNIEFVGRKDGQVKIRGYRIELTEVEGIIREFEGIRDVTVAAFDETGGGKYIAAYIVSDHKVDISAVKDFIAKSKPTYMVPAVIMQIDSIPLNQNQKVNKKALPLPQREVRQFVMPQNEAQEKIYQTICDIVGHKEFDIETDLKEVVSSIGMIKLNVLLSEAFDIVMTIKDLSEHHTIKKLEDFILSGCNKIAIHEKRDQYPLSETQKGIFVECISNAGSTIYNIPFLFQLKQEVTIDQVTGALKQVMENHSYLKTTLQMSDEEEILQLRRDENEVILDHVELTDQDFEAHKPSMVRPFDLLGGNLYNLTFYKTPSANYLFMDFHHIIMDGYSLNLILTELAKSLKGENLKPETYSGFDVALDEEQSRKSEKLWKAKEYFKNLVALCPKDTKIPCDKEDAEEQVHSIELPLNITKSDTKNVLNTLNVTENAFFTGAFALLMAKYNHGSAGRFTTIYNGRSDSRTENTTAMLVKTLPVALQVQGNVKDFLINAKEQLMNSMTHDIYSFGEISRELDFVPHTMFVYQGETDGFGEANYDFGTSQPLHLNKAKAWISLNVYIQNDAYYLNCEYRGDLYNEDTIRHLSENLALIAQQLLQARDTSEITLPFDVQKEYIPLVNKSFMELFEENVRKHPKKTAIIDEDGEITYETLDQVTNGLAALLIEKGVNKSCIGACCGRRRSFMISVISILKAGCSYLPIDPEYPKDRVDYMLTNSEASVLLYESGYSHVVDTFSKEKIIVDDCSKFAADHKPAVPAFDFDDLAYTIYTSGSTGKPKGVMLTHLAFTNLLHNTQKVFQMKEEDIFSAFSSFCFDASVIELFPIIAFGGTLYIIPEGVKKDVLAVCHELVKKKVTLSCFPTQMGELVADNLTMENSMGYIMMGGEKMKHYYNRTFTVINGYGPTESAVSCTSFYVDQEYKSIPIGKPWINTPAFVLDQNLRPVPVGQPGELCLGGTQLAVGYKNNEEKTKAAFVKNPDESSPWKRLYRTGDIVKMLGDGNMEYVGRIDNQVKISGYRIELGEIEGAIAKHSKVKETVVTVYDSGAAKHITAYYTASNHISEQELKEFLTPLIPEYMMPAFFVHLEQMPVTPGGKVDKKALPLPAAEKGDYVPPANDNEKILCEIFAKTLGVDKVGITDHFFEMGGTSLAVSKIAIQCANRKLPIVYGDIFKMPTVKELAQKLEPVKTEAAVQKITAEPQKTALPQKKWAVLSHNNMNYVNDMAHLPLGNVLVSGVTGFLGIHVLRELINSDADKIYCLVRRGEYESAQQRLHGMLFYYFENTYESLFPDRIEVMEGDITQDDLNELLKNTKIDCIINCAACVKHFAADDILEKVNVQGVKNLIQVAMKKCAKLIQISTVSVSGDNINNQLPGELEMTEDMVEFGQEISNKYIESKLKAEIAVLKGVEKGLKGKVIRVGNLMSRHSDGEFQINFSTNGFMRSIKAYASLGKFPLSAMNELIDFSPIDSTAKAIVALAAAPDSFTVFHAFNNHRIEMGDVIYAINQYGIKIDPVSDNEFQWALEQGMNDPQRSIHISGLLTYLQSDDRNVKEIDANNLFTTSALYRLNVKWPLISEDYLAKTVAALDTLGYF